VSAPLDLQRLARPMASLLRVPAQALDDCLVAAVESDLPAIEAMRREVIGAELTWDDRAYLRWRYRLGGPPARKVADTAPGTSHLWLFKRGDEILGCLGAERLTLATPGGRHDALRFLDLMSLPRVKGLGIGAWLNLKLIPQVEVAISVGGSDQSIGMIGRLFHRMPDRHIWALPLRTGPLITARWPQTARLPLVGAASRVADLALGAKRRIDRRFGGAPLQVEETAAADESVGALGETMARAGFTLASRTAAHWRWRYADNPRARYTQHAVRRGGRTVAALVSRQSGDLGEIVDWVWDADQPQTDAQALLLTLFTTVIDGFARRGATKARVMTYDAVSEAVCRRIGMRERPTRSAYAVRARPALEKQLLDARWFVTFGDSDGD
jgi:hypothetical protein